MAGYDARAHLASLVGRTLRTAGQGRANRVIRIEGDTVLVATDRSPHGESVPIAWLQSAGERLLAERELRITPREIGYRSAFIGAVLQTLPDVVVEERPLRLRLTADAPVSEEQPAVEELVRGHRRGGERLTAAARQAVERHAMARVAEWLRAEGWSLTDTSADSPYDFLADRSDERRYVEVKGTTGDGATVIVTAGEVDHARAHPDDSLLAVVSNIRLDVTTDREPKATAGSLRYTTPWRPADDDLRPLAFTHTPHALHEPTTSALRGPSDDWDGFVAAVAAERQRTVAAGDWAWRSVSEALRRNGWNLAPYQPGGASGAVLRRAINHAFARGLVPDDGSLVKRQKPR